MLLDFIDLQSGTGAMYKRLYGAVYAAILSGVIKDGERLPSIREAAAQLSVSRTTVENAYLRLCMEGLAESLPQRGYFIRGVLPAKPVIRCRYRPVEKNRTRGFARYRGINLLRGRAG